MYKLVLFLVGFVSADVPYNFPEKVPLPKVDQQVYDEYRLALDAIFGLGIRLQAFLADDQHDNFLVSPISAAVVIGQLMLGADDQFRDQLVDLLFLPNEKNLHDELINYQRRNITYELPYTSFHLQMSGLLNDLGRNHKQQFVLKQNTALFFDRHVLLRKRFRLYLRTIYLTDLYQMNFTEQPEESQKLINDWAKKNTQGLINTILSKPSTAKTSSIFANAIYFFAEWQHPFSDLLNRDGLFNINATSSVPVTYMVGLVEQILYVESPQYKMICLPYKNEELGMYILLPNPEGPFKYNIKAFVQSLNATQVAESISKGKRINVTVKIPKMSLSHTFSLIDKLKKYKQFKKYTAESTAQNSTANAFDTVKNNVDRFNNFSVNSEDDIFLSKATYAGGSLQVNDIVQQVLVTVNEKGTEAAAVTASTVDYILSKNFAVDRPFVFFIRHEQTSATLFWGTIANPTA